MKKYKLIKEYPGSPELGCIIQNLEGTNMYFYNRIQVIYPDKYPQFWEEVIEKDYEILSLNIHDTRISDMRGHGNEYIKALLNDRLTKIHSVKRLSDGEIFTIGDKVVNSKAINKGNGVEIFDIILNIDNILLFGLKQTEIRQPITYLEKVKQPLFKTEDGVNIYLGDTFWFVKDLTSWTIESVIAKNTFIAGAWKRFSTKEAAEEYILMNKPCLSINEMLNAINYGNKSILEELKELVKQKLK